MSETKIELTERNKKILREFIISQRPATDCLDNSADRIDDLAAELVEQLNKPLQQNYKIGSVFKIVDAHIRNFLYAETHVCLVQVSADSAKLINLSTGNRYDNRSISLSSGVTSEDIHDKFDEYKIEKIADSIQEYYSELTN